MSDSPPLPQGFTSDAHDHNRNTYDMHHQGVYGNPQTANQSGIGGAPAGSLFPDQPSQQPFSLFRLDMPAGQLFYQPQSYAIPQPFAQQPSPFPVQSTPSLSSDSSDLKSQRKTKGHVASACVPCKKAHLRCDAQRPCTRCLSVGKEESCIDVQHKKRGRPRLRDEREIRYDGMTPPYGQSHTDNGPRGSVPHYASRDTQFDPNSGGTLQRSGSYRVLKSQSTNSTPLPLPGAAASQYLDGSMPKFNTFAQQSTNAIMPSHEPCYAFMNLEFRVVKSTASFQHAVGIPSLDSRRIQELVPSTEVDKVNRVLKIFENERRQREPAYHLPIYVKPEDDKIVQTVDFGQEESSGVSLNVQETLTFVGADGRYRSCHVRMGLSKKFSTYFIVATMPTISSIQPNFQQHYTSSQQFSREMTPREQQYGYQNTAQNFMQQPISPHYAQSAQHFAFHTTGNIPNGSQISIYPHSQQPSSHSGSNLQSFQGLNQSHPQPFSTSNSMQQYPARQSQAQYQSLATHPRPNQGQQHRDLQLPPIRDPTADTSGESRGKGGRVDIGGLIDNGSSTR